MKNCLIYFVLALLILCCFPLSAGAQGKTLKKDGIVVASDSIPAVLYDYLVSSTSKHFHDPSIPRFLIKDKNYNYVLGIGGYVQAIGLYDFSGMSGTAFVVGNIPIRSETNPLSNTDVVDINLTQSRLFFKLIGNTRFGMLNAYIETDFNGSGGVLRLRQAYFQYLGLTIGQAWTTFKDSESPNTLDTQGPVSLPDRRVPLVRYVHEFGDFFKAAISIEMPQTTQIIIPAVANAAKYEVYTIPQNIPDVPVAVSWTKGPLHLFGAVNLRLMKCPLTAEKYSNVFTFASQLSFRYDFFSNAKMKHTIYGQGIYARGMVDCIQDMLGMGLNIVVNEDLTSLSVNSGFGWYAGYKFLYLNNEVNAVYSMSESIGIKNNSYNLYKIGNYLAVNYMRNFLKWGKMGAEFIWGKKLMTSSGSGNNY